MKPAYETKDIEAVSRQASNAQAVSNFDLKTLTRNPGSAMLYTSVQGRTGPHGALRGPTEFHGAPQTCVDFIMTTFVGVGFNCKRTRWTRVGKLAEFHDLGSTCVGTLDVQDAKKRQFRSLAAPSCHLYDIFKHGNLYKQL